MAFGEPGKEIIKWVDQKRCDLVAMGTHGHKLIGDLLLGATASRVQHNISVPVLLLSPWRLPPIHQMSFQGSRSDRRIQIHRALAY